MTKSVKVVIFAGGFGTRLSEETRSVPKPMVEIGGFPILWHIMSIYGAHGFSNFLIACGYKKQIIKQYFSELYRYNSDLHIDLSNGAVTSSDTKTPNWKVGCIDTGLHTMTGGRLLRLRKHLGTSTFMVTYGDGLSNVDISQLLEFHYSHKKLATVTAIHPPPRFGGISLEGDQVKHFTEKPSNQKSWINGGFFVFEPEVLNYIENDTTRLESKPLTNLAADNELRAFRHSGFWKPMDTLREKIELETLWETGEAPWKIW